MSIKIEARIKLLLLSALAYVLMDIPVRVTEFFPINVGLKSFLPSTMGLFFGPYGAAGCCIGCLISSLVLRVPLTDAGYECYCIIINSIILWYGWHFFSRSHRIHFKTFKKYAVYIMLLAVSSALCFDVRYALSYFSFGLIVGLPINILLCGPLSLEPVLPSFAKITDDAVFTVDSDPESLERANEVLEATSEEKGVNMARMFEIESCIEELTIRILEALPDTKIKVNILYSEAISIRMHYNGKKYNPLLIAKGEDIIDLMSLKIIRHRALRASFSYFGGENNIHVVV